MVKASSRPKSIKPVYYSHELKHLVASVVKFETNIWEWEQTLAIP